MAVRADLAVFALGALLFAAGLFGISTLPPGDGAGLAGTYSVAWREQAIDLTFESATLAEGGRASADLPVAERNLTRIVFTFTCNDRNPIAAQNAANLDVLVTGPDGLTGEASGRCDGPIDVDVAIQDDPSPTTTAGASEAEARASVLATRATTRGVGSWTAELALSRPVGLPVGGVVGGAQVDVSAAAVRHEPSLTIQPR